MASGIPKRKRISILISPFGEKNPQLTNFSQEKKKKKRRVFARESKKKRTEQKKIRLRTEKEIRLRTYCHPPLLRQRRRRRRRRCRTRTPSPSRDASRLSPPAIRATHRHKLDRAASEREKNKKKFHCRRSVAGVSSFKQSISLSLSSLIIYTFVFNIHFHQRQQQQLYFVRSGRKQDHKFHSFYCRNKQESASIAGFVAIKPSPLFFSIFICRS